MIVDQTILLEIWNTQEQKDGYAAYKKDLRGLFFLNFLKKEYILCVKFQNWRLFEDERFNLSNSIVPAEIAKIRKVTYFNMPRFHLYYHYL